MCRKRHISPKANTMMFLRGCDYPRSRWMGSKKDSAIYHRLKLYRFVASQREALVEIRLKLLSIYGSCLAMCKMIIIPCKILGAAGTSSP